MTAKKPTYQELEARLAAAEEIIAVLQAGQVDAVVGYEDFLLVRLKEVEEALRQQQERLSVALAASGGAIYEHSIPLDVTTYHDDRWAEILGYRPDDLPVPDRFLDWLFEQVHPEDRQPLQRAYTDFIEGRTSDYHVEIRLRHKQGHWIWVDGLSVASDRDEQGRVRRLVGMMTDITQRKDAEVALQQSEERFRLVVENSWDGIHQLDLRTNRYVFMSPAQEKLTGFPLDELEGLSLTETFARLHPDDREKVTAYLQTVISGDDPGEPMEYRWTVKSGHYRWFSDSRKLVRDRAGRPVSLIGVSRDITARKEAEAALRQLTESLEQQVADRTAEIREQADQLRALTLQLGQTEQRERRRMAQTLHDYVQQYIVAAKLRVEWIVNQTDGADQLHGPARQADEILDKALEASRALTLDLYPPALEMDGLAGGLSWLADSMAQKYQLTVSLRLEEHAEPAREDLRFFLFESARELLFNTAKHAGVKAAALTLARTADGRIELAVSDQGRGFEPDRLRNRNSQELTYGLFSLQQRLAHLGGRLEIKSVPGEGTTVTLTAPVGAGSPGETVAE